MKANGGNDDALRMQVEEQLHDGRASKRARDVAALILTNGSCTTSDIEAMGYKHSPRAVGDLRDSGVEVTKVMESYTDLDTGSVKRRARYSISGIADGKQSRRAVSKSVSIAVKVSGRCEACGSLPPLQVDHRVPFEIGGETYPHVVAELMPLCASCNRSKSWDCEHCPNREEKATDICKSCFWASPKDYEHVATKQIREIRATLLNEEDIKRFDRIQPDVETVIREYLKSKDQ